MRSKLVKFLGLALLCLSGCGPQAVLVGPGHVVRLADPVSARVYVPNGTGGYVVSQNTVTIPAGWYAAPPPSTQPTTRP
jgi:hypothetical protein